jgi:hypothetical protein
MDTAIIGELMQKVYDYFLTLYHQNSGTASGSTFLSFVPIGTPVDPATFRLNPIDSMYSKALAVEHFSELTNRIPAAINADVFQPTSKTVDGFYNLLLLGSTPATVDNNTLTLFSALKAQAEQQFEPTLGSLLQQQTQFHPTYATPADWYDPSVESNWTSYSFSMTQTQETTETTGSPPILPPIRINPAARSWEWQVLPGKLSPVLENPRLKLIENSNLDEQVRLPSRSVANLHSLPLHLAAKQLNLSTVNLSTAINASQVSPDLNAVSLAEITPIEAESAATATVNTAALNTAALNTSALSAATRELITVQRPISRAIEMEKLVSYTSSQSVSSNNLTVTFKYCLVNADRPWLNQAYLATKGWSVPGYTAGGFSTGTADNNNGVFPALPIACLVIKNLQITADWTQEDITAAQQSAAFGPFSLVGRSIDQTTNTLICDGMQIIGWICQIMPLLPPADSTT